MVSQTDCICSMDAFPRSIFSTTASRTLVVHKADSTVNRNDKASLENIDSCVIQDAIVSGRSVSCSAVNWSAKAHMVSVTRAADCSSSS